VSHAATGRIVRTGHWIPYTTEPQRWDFRGADAPDESVYPTDRLNGAVYGQPLDITLVSPRPCEIGSGSALVKTAKGNPAVVRHAAGKGRAFLLGFCLQDTYFKMWQDKNVKGRAQLGGLLRSLTEKAGVKPHVRSSNPEIEAAVRANAKGGFLFVINHEAEKNDARIQLSGLEFSIGGIVDVDTGGKVQFTEKKGAVEVSAAASKDQARIYRLISR
jgi:hypothetical protein